MQKLFGRNFGIMLALVLLTGCTASVIETDHYDDMKGGDVSSSSSSSESSKKDISEKDKYLAEFTKINKENNPDIPREYVEEYYDKIGPSAMLDVIEQDPYCHDKGHNIGKVVFKRSDQNLGKAMNTCNQRCTSGCFHGILMEKFGEIRGESDSEDHIDFNDIEEEITQICNEESISKDIGIGDCAHAVGHAVAFLADYVTTIANEACNLYDDPALTYYCSTGVFMERDIVYGKEDRNEESILYPCDEDKHHPAACYRYKIRRAFKLNIANIQNIKDICMTLETKEEQAGCYHGLGMAYFKWIRKYPDQLPPLCQADDPIAERLCIEGAIGKLRVYSREKAAEACTHYEGDQAKICLNAFKTGNFGMSKDFSLYHYIPPR